MTTEEPQRELADASQVIAALTIKLDRANETIEGLEATIESLRHERDRERAGASKNWDALSNRIARLEEAVEAYQKAYTPDGHTKPHDCFSTGPRTGDPIQDFIVCPGCWAQQKAKEAKP